METIKIKKATKKVAFALPHWGPYTNHQRQLKTLWDWFVRLCNEDKISWTCIKGNPFDKGGSGTIEGAPRTKNAVFTFSVENGLIIRGTMF